MIVPGPQLLAHLHPSDDDQGDGDFRDDARASDDDGDESCTGRGDDGPEEGLRGDVESSSRTRSSSRSTSRRPRLPREGPKGDQLEEGGENVRNERPKSDAVVVLSLPAAAMLTLAGFAAGAVLPPMMASPSWDHNHLVGYVCGASDDEPGIAPSCDGFCHVAGTSNWWCWNWPCFLLGAAAAVPFCVFLALSLSSPPEIVAGGSNEGCWHRSVLMCPRIVKRLGGWRCATIIDRRSAVLGKAESLSTDACGVGYANRDCAYEKDDDDTRRQIEGRGRMSTAAATEEGRQRQLRHRRRIAAALGSVHAPPPAYHHEDRRRGDEGEAVLSSSGHHHSAARPVVGGTTVGSDAVVENASSYGGGCQHFPRHRHDGRGVGAMTRHYADLAEAHAGLLSVVDTCLSTLRVASGLRLGLGHASVCVPRAERAFIGRMQRHCRSSLHPLGLDRARRSVFLVLRGAAKSLSRVREEARWRRRRMSGGGGPSAGNHHSRDDDDCFPQEHRRGGGDGNGDDGEMLKSEGQVSTDDRRRSPSGGRDRNEHRSLFETSSSLDEKCPPSHILTLSFLEACRRDVARSLSRCIDGGTMFQDDGICCGTSTPSGSAPEDWGDSGGGDDDESKAVLESVQLAREAVEYLNAAFANIGECCRPIDDAVIPAADVTRLRKMREVLEAATVALWSFEETVTQRRRDAMATEFGDTKQDCDETVSGGATDWWSQCGDLVVDCLERYRALDADMSLVSRVPPHGEGDPSCSCEDGSRCVVSEECGDDNPEAHRTEYEDRGKLRLGHAKLERNVSNVTVVYSATVEEKRYPTNKRCINRNKKLGANCRGSRDELPHFDSGAATGNLVKELRRRLDAMSIPKEINAVATHSVLVQPDDDASKPATNTKDGFTTPFPEGKRKCESLWLGVDKSLLSELVEAQKDHRNLVQACEDATAGETFIGES